MKRYTLLILFFVGICAVSCKKDFLNRPDINNPTLDTYYTNAAQVNGATGLLYGYAWFPFMDRAYLSIGDIMGGTGITQGPGDYAPYMNFTVSQTDAQVLNAWKAFYKVAGSATILMNAFEAKKASASNPAYLNQGIAEAHFIRAVAYFYLARIFRDVPIVTDPVALASSSDIRVPRYIQSDVLKFVIQELKAAESGLGETPYQPGRVTTYSAKGMMAKVYLYMGDYENAKAKAQEVINSGKYDLFSDYYQMFSTDKSNNNIESLFALQWIVGGDYQAANHLQTNIGPAPLLAPINAGGYSSVVPSITLLQSFEPGDKRRQVIMEQGWTRSDWTNVNFPNGFKYDTLTTGSATDQALKIKNATRTNSAKYVTGTGSNGDNVIGSSTDMNTYILRYADVLLIYAEAVLGNNSSTSDPSALAAFNKVRARAGLPALNTLTKDIILKERMIEFNFEGDYWFDVQRQGFEKAKQILWSQERGTYDYNGKLQHVDVKLQFTNASQLYLPIPASEITVNDLLAQPAVPYYK
jgi:hypothetical protein